MAAPKRKVPARATPPIKAARKPVARKKATASAITPFKILRWSLMLLVLSFLVAGIYHYRHGVLYYLGFKSNKRIDVITKDEKKIGDLRIYEIVSRHKDRVFGFDISHYQGSINWDSIERTKATFR